MNTVQNISSVPYMVLNFKKKFMGSNYKRLTDRTSHILKSNIVDDSLEYNCPNYIRLVDRTAYCVNSDKIDEAVEYCNKNKIDTIIISPDCGFTKGNLNFIFDITHLIGIFIYDIGRYMDRINFSAIEKYRKLQFLTMGDTSLSLDLSRLTNLIWLFLEWNPKTKLPSVNNNLQYLTIISYKKKSLETIPLYKNLTGLTLDFGSVVSLSGIERFTNLHFYQHSYGRNLHDISGLKHLPNLIELELNHCKKIYVDDTFEQCQQLKLLTYLDCANLPSLSFLKKLKNIVGFSFSNINIEDGDMTPLLKLKGFGFYPHKKHYSHTEKELKKIQVESGFIEPVNNVNNGFYTVKFDNGMEFHGECEADQFVKIVKKIEKELKTECAGCTWDATNPAKTTIMDF
jgi:hypothetical protein